MPSCMCNRYHDLGKWPLICIFISRINVDTSIDDKSSVDLDETAGLSNFINFSIKKWHFSSPKSFSGNHLT